MKRPGFYLIEVAPLSVLPLSRPALYSYRAAHPIPVGSWVRVPFGKGDREVDGVTWSAKKVPTAPPAWMKPVRTVIEESFLTRSQLQLAEGVSAEYFAPLGKTLRHFLPPRTQTRRKKPQKTGEKTPEAPESPLALVPLPKALAPEAKFLTAFRALKPGESAAYNPSFLPDHKRLLALLSQAVTKKGAQILILVPELILFPRYRDFFERHFAREMIAVLHSKLSRGAYFSAWENIRSGQARLILATRQGLFAPFARLDTIVVTEEEDESYKQWDMTPRYEGKRVARLLASQDRVRVLLSSVAPSLESVYRAQNRSLSTFTPLLAQKPLATAVELVNLKLERFQKNYSPLSAPLRRAIGNALKERQQVLLYVERQGTSAFSVCTGCKNIFRCPRCGRALSSSSEGFFRCPACHYQTALFPGCPVCRGLTFRHIGFGTARLEREVKKAFSQARVARADSESMKSQKALEALVAQGQAGAIDILIGTQMILNDPPLPELALTAIIDADSLLSRPDFRADERYFHLLIRSAENTSCRTNGVVVQTFHPESTLNQRIIQLSPQDLYEHMLGEREATGYPPYTRSLLLSCVAAREKESQKNVERAKDELTKLVAQLSGSLTSLTEKPKYLRKERLYLSALALRIPDGDLLPPTLVAALRRLSPECRVDVDPLSLYV